MKRSSRAGILLTAYVLFSACLTLGFLLAANPKGRTVQSQAPDSPAEAAEFYRLKRAPNGEGPIPVERYLTAREHIKGMLRYSTRLNQLFPSENSTGPMPELVELGS